jgi:hypothetical protein
MSNDKSVKPEVVLHKLQFRAVLVSPSEKLERPLQTIHPTREVAERWAEATVEGRPPGAYVSILKTEEAEVARVYALPPAEEKPAAPAAADK